MIKNKKICQLEYHRVWNLSECNIEQRKHVFYFLSNLMGYEHGDNFSFDSEPNGFPFGSNSKGKLSPRSSFIELQRKWNIYFHNMHGIQIFYNSLAEN